MCSGLQAVIADRLSAAFTAGDADTLRELLHPEAVIWHNYDRVNQSVDEVVATVAGTAHALRNLRYEDVRRLKIEDGYVQQHVLRGQTQDGLEICAEVCVIARIENSRVTRYEEYMDSAALAVLMPS